jgi:uncharacterized protein (DUF608 family)
MFAVYLIVFMQSKVVADSDPSSTFDSSTGTIIDSRWPCGVPLGGIGVGKIELLTDGSFGNFTINHNWDRPYGWAKGAFAAVRARSGSQAPVAKILRLIGQNEYAGVENIRHTRMQGWYPISHCDFNDDSLPVNVQLDAFSSLIPHDPKDSALPMACLTYTVTNPSAQNVHVSLLLAWPNLLGWNGQSNELSGDSQMFAAAGRTKGLKYTTTQTYPNSDERQQAVGEYFVSARSEKGMEITSCPSWDVSAKTPGFWESFVSSGHLSALDNGRAPSEPAGAIDAECDLAPEQSRKVRFYVAWAMLHHITIQPSNSLTLVSQGVDYQDRWTTGSSLAPGDSLVVDLGGQISPSQLMMDEGEYLHDYPRGLKVEISSDRISWLPVAERDEASVKASMGSGSLIAVSLQNATGHYLRLTNLGSDSSYWWSIHRLSLVVRGKDIPLVYANKSLSNIQEVGHYWQNWWSGAADITAYADKNADRFLQETRAWQEPVLKSSLPFWLKLKLINSAYPMFCNTILTKDGRFAVQESPHDMSGALGTMDQRMAAHAFMAAFFPELDQSELEMYAKCQQSDGRITHFDGNIHNIVGDPNVNYGITNWPDLSCSWVLQVDKLYRWTGNKSFLARMSPHIDAAMEFLKSGDLDNDSIPEGGSTYDYESAPPGAFIYSADCYLGALRAASSLANPAQAQSYDERFAHVQQSVMRELWNGEYFRKWYVPSTGKANDDSFVAALAGDWLAHLTGLRETLPPGIAHKEIAQIIARHQKPFYPVPPMEVTPYGKAAVSMCFFLQHEPYLGCESIYQNYVDDGLDTIYRVYHSVLDLDHSPWAEPLVFFAPGGKSDGLVTYMTGPATWHVLNALSGASLDLPDQRIYLSPRLASTETELHMPIYFSRFWGWLDYAPKANLLRFRVTKVFRGNSKIQDTLYHFDGAKEDDMPKDIIIQSVAADGNGKPLFLPVPFVVKPGAVLDLSVFMSELGLPKQSEIVESALPMSLTGH